MYSSGRALMDAPKRTNWAKTQDEFWTLDEPLGELTFEGTRTVVRLRIHQHNEPFQRHTAAREFVPLTVPSGIRTKVVAQPYTFGPNSGIPKGRHTYRIGEGEAYYYLDDHILLLWKCRLGERYKVEDPTADQNLDVFWEQFERFLLTSFPATTQMVTPAWNLPYAGTLWRQFLHRHGFTRPSPAGIPGMAYISDVGALPNSLCEPKEGVMPR